MEDAAKSRPSAALWALRLVFASVLAMNLACALQFIVEPGAHVAAYGLSGRVGEAALQGLGVAFLMWNVTYPAFIACPERFSVLGWVILAQQAIGLVGETAILLGLGPGQAMLGSSIGRFILCDGLGLVAMAGAFAVFLVAKRRRLRLQ